MSAERRTTLRGLGVMAWALATSLLCTLLVEQRGLRWVQGVVWPTELYSYQQVEDGPVDVAIIGSSRAAFGLSPSSIDRCLSQELGRPTHTVNISRAFGTAYTLDLLAEDLLSGARRPEVLVLVAEPELFDEHNPRLPVNVSTTAGLRDMPDALAAAYDLSGVFAALRPIARGPETIALYLSGRWDTKPWLRWLMLHHGGGLYCSGGEHCRAHNHAMEATLEDWWDVVITGLLPQLDEERYPAYEPGTGRVHAHAERLLERAEADGTTVVLAELPRHPAFLQAIPDEVEPAYRAYLEQLGSAHPWVHHPAIDAKWTRQRTYYLDAEHLTAAGAHKASKELCTATLVPLLAAEGGE